MSSATARGLAAALLAVTLSFPASGAKAESPPQVVRIGLVAFFEKDVNAKERDTQVREYLRSVATESTNPLGFVLVHGTYYQVLGWLEQGSIDGALLSGWSSIILEHESKDAPHGSPLAELIGVRDFHTTPAGESPRCLVLGTEPKPLSRLNMALKQQAFHSLSVACEAHGERAAPCPPSRVRPVELPRIFVVNHLSTTGFVPLTVLATQALAAGPDKARDSNLEKGELIAAQSEQHYWNAIAEALVLSFNHGALTTPPGSFSFGSSGASAPYSDEVHFEIAPPIFGPSDRLYVPQSLRGLRWDVDVPAIAESRERSYKRTSAPGADDSPRNRLKSVFEDAQRLRERGFGPKWLPLSISDALSSTFTPTELLNLLAIDQGLSSTSRLALVLPGGGVKSMYQAVALDTLRTRREYRLALTDSKQAPKHHPIGPALGSPNLDAEFIVGTSGGALTGALLSRFPRRSLQPLMSDLRLADVFPVASVAIWLAALSVMTIVAVGLFIGEFLRQKPAEAWTPPVPTNRRAGVSLLVVLLTWAALTKQLPVILGLEVPAVRPGAFLIYALLIVLIGCIAMRPANDLPDEREAPSALGSLGFIILMLLFAGGTTWVGAQCPKYWREIAVLGLLITLIVHIVRSESFPDFPRDGHCIVIALGLTAAAATIGLSIAGVLQGALLGGFSLTEQVGVGISALIVGLSSPYWGSRLTPRPHLVLLQPVVLRRNPRSWIGAFLLFQWLGAGIWLLTTANGLVDPGTAHRSILTKLECEQASPCSLRVPLIVSVAVMDHSPEKGSVAEHYAGFVPPGNPKILATRRTLSIVEDSLLSRWLLASGSPFPLLPPSRLTINGSEHDCVDGGFAHNTPIEAAVDSGARQVLVLGSSPTERRFQGIPFLSDTARYLIALPDYLFDRSQEVDRRISRLAMVGVVEPLSFGRDGHRRTFPFLAAFTPSALERVAGFAIEDFGLTPGLANPRQRRVGRLASWGQPGIGQIILPIRRKPTEEPTAR